MTPALLQTISTDPEPPHASPVDGEVCDASVIIVSFNTRETLRESLRSVEREAEDLRTEILVVDNNSRDGSPEMVEEEFSHVRLLRSEVNLGFGGANNLAIEAARGRYIVLLNSDAFLLPGSLRIAIERMDGQPRVGLAGAQLVGRDSSWQPSARMFPHVMTDAFVLSGLAARYPSSRVFGRFDRTWADQAAASEVDWVPGAFSIVRPEALRAVGVFDDRFFLYAEEVDLCRRIKSAGFQVWYWPDVRVVHVGGESSRQIKSLDFSPSGSQVVRWRMRSTLLYYRKHHGGMAWFAKWLELGLYGLSALRNRWSDDPRRRLRYRTNQALATQMRLAWKETQGGRVSPQRPW
jgi:GT2 family glycosyltransferase